MNWDKIADIASYIVFTVAIIAAVLWFTWVFIPTVMDRIF